MGSENLTVVLLLALIAIGSIYTWWKKGKNPLWLLVFLIIFALMVGMAFLNG
jgi:hypothetical protein